MSSQLVNPNPEAAIWARLMQAKQDGLSPEVAEFLLAIAFEESGHARLAHLAERSESGALTPEEQSEFDGYLHIANWLAVMQSRARLPLQRHPDTGPQ